MCESSVLLPPGKPALTEKILARYVDLPNGRVSGAPGWCGVELVTRSVNGGEDAHISLVFSCSIHTDNQSSARGSYAPTQGLGWPPEHLSA
ncbi:hypothetical protein MGG_17923 [Pyricularia oryzae 70-15]|uniref:Uncharacterized protein n=3 Tax=Pyricularia oryzae TaxID=318829 RepID=G4NLJ3_PYRO7|nr:uncharacterized protein MGG_17923 [Pyricularia oryzae 70-15]EHA46046.1 hypothetical protein MGG_17923 [Pyricularia oryzae 70-15]ELQ40178.1 hypothetical protein OOU_Y34scaffold00458g6 [Pyricularia oryzae Y34]